MNKVLQFLEDTNTPYMTEGNHHCREGWVQICCPFCVEGDNGYHLGINMQADYGNCYKCGWHSMEAIISQLTGCRRTEAKMLKLKIGGTHDVKEVKPKSETGLPFVLPGELITNHDSYAYKYLQGRLFELTDNLIAHYQLRSTDGFYQFKTEKDGKQYLSNKYASTIVIPNKLDGEIVSFQTKSYLPESKGYITAKPCEELVHHKQFLWGIDDVPGDTVVVCEAAFDAMTIGDGAVHTHGINITQNQLDELATFKNVYVAYDSDEAGRRGAKSIINRLSHRTTIRVIDLQNEAKDINELLTTKHGRDTIKQIKELLQ